jgi:hypothetical protein
LTYLFEHLFDQILVDTSNIILTLEQALASREKVPCWHRMETLNTYFSQAPNNTIRKKVWERTILDHPNWKELAHFADGGAAGEGPNDEWRCYFHGSSNNFYNYMRKSEFAVTFMSDQLTKFHIYASVLAIPNQSMHFFVSERPVVEYLETFVARRDLPSHKLAPFNQMYGKLNLCLTLLRPNR